MANHKAPIHAVPCNIITGFLGAGKSSAIMNLLANKPESERWAVLVNEFGEIGIDGGLIQTLEGEAGQQVFVKEVPGGCMCCATGVPIGAALKMLLSQSKPDRLIVEPTGLGHPLSIVRTLQGDYFGDVVTLKSTLTLVDARNIADSRYTDNDRFKQQLEVADIIVANKADLYSGNEFDQLTHHLQRTGLAQKPVYQTEMAQLQLQWLNGDSALDTTQADFPSYTPAQEALFVSAVKVDQVVAAEAVEVPTPGDDNFPSSGVLHLKNQGDDFEVLGWLFDPKYQFNKQQLDALLHTIKAERLKGLLNTDQGFVSYNMAAAQLTVNTVSSRPDSRIEIITDAAAELDGFEQSLMACLTNHSSAP